MTLRLLNCSRKRMRRYFSQWLSVDRGSVDDAALQGVLQQLFESDGDITVWDDADYIVAEIGGY